jgi:hypothetical protein
MLKSQQGHFGKICTLGAQNKSLGVKEKSEKKKKKKEKKLVLGPN